MAALLLSMVPASGAWAAGSGWGAPADLSVVGATAEYPRLATDARGDATAVWFQAGDVAGTGDAVVFAAQRSAGGSWQPPVSLSPVGELALFPQLAVDARGDALVVWPQQTGQPSTPPSSPLVAAFKPAGAAWQPPVTVSGPGQLAGAPSLAVEPSGDAVAVWTVSVSDQTDAVYAADRLFHSGLWGPPVRISEVAEDVLPEVAVDSRGDAAVIWKRYVSGSASRGTTWAVEAATRDAGAAWRPPVAIGSESDAPAFPGPVPTPQIALDSRGDATALWQGHDSAGSFVVQSETRTAGGAWQPPMNVSVPTQSPLNLVVNGSPADPMPALAVDAAGEAIAAWNGTDGQNQMATAAIRPGPSAAWQPPINVSAAGADNFNPAVAIDARGNALAIWSRATNNNQGSELEAATRPAGAAWQLAVTISDPGQNAGTPAGVFDALGDATAIWMSARGQQQGDVIESASRGSGTAPPPPVSLTNVHFAPRRFRVAVSDTALSARTGTAPRGSTLVFTLSGQADLTIMVRPATPAATGKPPRCHKRKERRRSARSCVPPATTATLTRIAELAGRDTIAFSGLISHRALAPGHYRATLLATDVFGGHTRATTGFTIQR